MKVVRVQFPQGGRQYDYYVQPGDNPDIGDFVITSYCAGLVPSEENHNLKPAMATVVGLLMEGAPHRANKPYLFMIPHKVLNERLSTRNRFAAHVEAQNLAKERLRILVQEQTEMGVFETLAAANPEAAKLLELLKASGPCLSIEGSTS